MTAAAWRMEAQDSPGGHFGLLGIRERVDKLGGCSIDGEPGAGTRLRVTIPAQRRRRPDPSSRTG